MQFRTPKAVSIQVNDISVPVDLVDAFPTLLPGTICRKPIWWQKHAKAMVDFCLVCLNPNEFRIDLSYPSHQPPWSGTPIVWRWVLYIYIRYVLLGDVTGVYIYNYIYIRYLNLHDWIRPDVTEVWYFMCLPGNSTTKFPDVRRWISLTV